MTRQEEGDAGALIDLGMDARLAAGLAHETVDHRQAQPCAHPDRLGGEEGIEGLGDHLGRHAAAVVGHREGDVFARFQVADPGHARIQRPVGGLDEDATALGHGVAGIDAEVEQGVFQLRRIDQGRPQLAAGHHLDLDRRTHRAADQVFHAGHQAIDVGGLGIQRLPAGKGQQPVGQGGGADGGALGGGGVALEIVQPALADAHREQIQTADDAGEQVVEIMSQAAGELADRFHLLRLAQLLFQQRLGLRGVPFPGDVAPGAGEAILFGVHRQRPGQPAPAAVRRQDAIFHPRRQAAAAQFVQRHQHPRQIVGMDEFPVGAAEQLGFGIAQAARPGGTHP